MDTKFSVFDAIFFCFFAPTSRNSLWRQGRRRITAAEVPRSVPTECAPWFQFYSNTGNSTGGIRQPERSFRASTKSHFPEIPSVSEKTAYSKSLMSLPRRSIRWVWTLSCSWRPLAVSALSSQICSFSSRPTLRGQ